MISKELQSIIEPFNKQGKMKYIEAASKEQIASFEEKHKIQLPPQYKKWLMFSDGGELFLPAGIQLYGVAHKPVIDMANDDTPGDGYIVIGALASGDPVLCEKTGERISIYNREASRIEDDETYTDFFSFLSDLYDLLGIGE